MRYGIATESGNTIAKFVFESDRDICIDALREEHSDCGEEYFDAIDGGE